MRDGDLNEDVVNEKTKEVDKIMNDAISIASGQSEKEYNSSVDSSGIRNRWVRNEETGKWMYEPFSDGKGTRIKSPPYNRSILNR